MVINKTLIFRGKGVSPDVIFLREFSSDANLDQSFFIPAGFIRNEQLFLPEKLPQSAIA